MNDPVNGTPLGQDGEHNHFRMARVFYWVNTLRRVFISLNAIPFVLATAVAGILTFYSRTGELVFDGYNIWWKIALFEVEIELLRNVLESDAIGLLVEFVVTRHGISADLLSHAMGAVTSSLSGNKNWFYKFGFTSVTMFSSLLATVLVSFVLVPNPSSVNREPVKGSVFVQTNCLGGRYGKNYGATGQMLIFNASNEKFRLPDNDQAYGLYIKAATRRQIFVPKVPQIGPYSTKCNSDHQVNIVEARVLNVQGLLYDCEPKVQPIAKSIRNFPSSFANNSRDSFRILNESPTRIRNSDKKAKLYIRAVIAKQIQKVSMFELTCIVQAAEATIDAKMNDEGVMGLSLPKGFAISTKNLTLPPRVLGDLPNELDFALTNSIGARGIGVVEKYVATSFNKDWEGLVYWIATAYGVRSALKDTFADTDDRRPALNVMRLSTRRTMVEILRIYILWIPVGIVLFVRLASLFNTNMFNGNVKQVADWMNWSDGGHAHLLIERLVDRTSQPGPKLYVHVVAEEHGHKALRFSSSPSDRGDDDRRLRGVDINNYRSGVLRLRNTQSGYREYARRLFNQ